MANIWNVFKKEQADNEIKELRASHNKYKQELDNKAYIGFLERKGERYHQEIEACMGENSRFEITIKAQRDMLQELVEVLDNIEPQFFESKWGKDYRKRLGEMLDE